ncbi:DNA helicase RecQ [Novosphingobium sp.]|uniref:DNA helicase RecQ n=1 Tax=Novosphingobium sp. TaxID=1874826 RepID=UPI00286D907F|nr:DNA helicase RecQ [Novosphingobium sp.]
MTASPVEILDSVFGHAAFRGVQEAVIGRVMAGQHSLAVMPTGAGKSLCYQVPAVARAGTAIVISPLIALKHDQIRSAEAAGIRAASMTSADSDNAATAEAFRRGELDLLYVAPERASTAGFQALLERAPIALFAIDEAHCVSEWGHDFRPDYRMLRPVLDRFPDVPRLALTATADQATRADILRQLGIPDEGLIVAGFDRPNIRYAITARDSGTRQIIDLLQRLPGAGIVYAPSRKATEDIAAAITRSGREAAFYHAGLEPERRAAVQASFVASESMVMVATIAFGMGIDKPDVRFVAHAGVPKSIESYYQETGRAGRDGDDSVAVMFWAPADFVLARERLSEMDESRRKGERTRLDALSALVESPGCRRAILLRHFGESPPEKCGNCDNCLDAPGVADGSVVAQKLLSAAYRTGQSFGIGHLEKVLSGISDDRIVQRGHDRLTVFGILESDEARLLKPVARALQARGALVANEHGGLMLAGDARAILTGDVMLPVVLPPANEKRSRGGRGTRDKGGANPLGDPLFEALRALRRELAAEAGLPPYVIFHDATLREMASVRPASLAALGEIGGVGTRKLEAYGDAFLAVIRQH